jgi:hypothetical protein
MPRAAYSDIMGDIMYPKKRAMMRDGRGRGRNDGGGHKEAKRAMGRERMTATI